MSIQLDWDVESDGEVQQWMEDPAEVAARRRAAQRRQRGWIAAGVLLVVGAVVAGVRAYQIRELRREMLVATVESEALALRIGDRTAFLRRQSADPLWQMQQQETFDNYQAMVPDVSINGEIADLKITRDEALVTLSVTAGGERLEAQWAYAYTADKGWRHAASPVDPWNGQQAHESDGFRFSYDVSDRALALALDRFLSEWRAEAQTFTGVEDLRPIDVWLDKQARNLRWAPDSDHVLIVPVRYIEPDGSLSSETFPEPAMLLAGYWIRDALGSDRPEPADRWLYNDLITTLAVLLDPESLIDRDIPPVSALDALDDVYGPEFIPMLIGHLRAGEPANQAVVTTMQATAPADLGGQALLDYLSRFLQAEITLRLRQTSSGGMPDERVRRVFTDVMVGHTETEKPFEPGVLQTYYYEADSVEVRSASMEGDILWAEVAVTARQPGRFGGSSTVTIYGLVPFRFVNSYWTRADYLPEETWGPLRSEQSGLVTVEYRQLDAEYVKGLAAALDESYATVRADLGVDTAKPLYVEVAPESQSGMEPPPFIDQGSEMQLILPTPHAVASTGPWTYSELLFYYAAYRIRQGTIQQVMGLEQGDNVYQYVASSYLLMWLSERASEPWWDSWYGTPAPDPDIEYRLADGWITPQSVPTMVPRSETDYLTMLIAYMALYDVVMEQYGPEGIHALTTNIIGSTSMEDWLLRSLETPLQDLEPAWEVRFRERLLDMQELLGGASTGE